MNDETERAWTRYISDAGKIAGRRNAVLCTGDIDAAADFGEDKSGRSLSGIVTVIPIGDFHYTWIDGVEDLNIFVWDLGPRQTAQFHNNELPLTVYGDDGTLTDAITSGAEIMITPTGGQYLIVEANLLVAAFP
jgi:L-ascorbate metabolism protein UlaG (beta-lactamase superfamily)